MQSFLKRLEPSDEAEDIFVPFAPKPNQPLEVGNVTISNAPAL